jgi:hypothetical protein
MPKKIFLYETVELYCRRGVLLSGTVRVLLSGIFNYFKKDFLCIRSFKIILNIGVLFLLSLEFYCRIQIILKNNFKYWGFWGSIVGGVLRSVYREKSQM